MKRVLVIGAGAAGLMAAAFAGETAVCTVLEQNEKAGKKLYITGKGRCNFTNQCGAGDYFSHIWDNPKFLYSAIYAFPPQDVIDFFEAAGMRTKLERGGRMFPKSDHASDVTKALLSQLVGRNVEVRYGTRVAEILTMDGAACGVRLENDEVLKADAVIVATGGRSYPSTGSRGDGYRFAEMLGHRIVPQRAALVGFHTKERFVAKLAGLTLKNIEVTLFRDGKTLFTERGELLFTHEGVSGPVVLSASFPAGDALDKGTLTLSIDMKPALDIETLDRRLVRELSENSNMHLKNVFAHLLPAKLAEELLTEWGIDAELPANAVSKKLRGQLVAGLKDVRLTVTKLGSLDEAIITRGGVDVKEVDPSTMASKKVKGLYFAGEVLDVAGFTGGYNLQIAWATGRLAGISSGDSTPPEV